MIDEEKQQDLDPNSTGETPEGSAMASETPPAPANSNEAADWELELAQAYQSAEGDRKGANASGDPITGSSTNSPTADAAESWKRELASVKDEKEALKTQLQATAAQLEDLKNQNLRLAADFDNFRRRTQKEKEELDLQARCITIKPLLPVIDNFERARSHIKPQNDGEMNIHKSYQSVYKQMVDSLKQIGVSPMRPEGEQFDPNLHEALLSEPTDEHEEGTIIQELERGYILGDRVLRHAKVKVAAPGISVVASDENPDSSES
ncbi:MAG: nucleotide exchange factor GrpE [Microcoleus sp. PH2017_10_PVI_O_A]|uniref:nucleotide exchange factor GrpE n=1 Tax=unclassified Microcoleus TaxID=2642155 RepID=UPI001DF1C0FA|nr:MULTISPECIES: nucleotide exchange factor GrpE [unclassified Microcoleus]TAE85794.1 MAG: nucleotide exchange factor GrpE [Oscillatoriales cyanobacterium]MCC3404227.1 nucleotide exchange factor GrpE [Microcoleus sp. PH2017_10_PVI_O_A]MCC3458313.1 nucleotide exchange factor GrpE [Microcoleus sp. PH2017_11_PCY_U_A]MCC3478384.1 nucleotide exchange factor GrpE [Microcoleus sp. PH2017_12_PCY_D_A]MCC3527259.1 nucleotide exchange factor GrpE [Microcoleus sp. PH2017_21_RUC_O_A]